MIKQLNCAWQARRVLLLGGSDDLTQLLQAQLTALGARPVRLNADASSETLYRAMTEGRMSAVIACVPLEENALRTLKTEAHETGVPLVLLCPQGDAQEAALSVLTFGVRFYEEALPCGVYAPADLTDGQSGGTFP